MTTEQRPTGFRARPAVRVTHLLSTSSTATGQRIRLPQEDVDVTAAIYEIPLGATLPIHLHPFPRYGYIISGKLSVTNEATGDTAVYVEGDFVVEAVGQWHSGRNIGSCPLRILVIDQVEAERDNVLLMDPVGDRSAGINGERRSG